MAVGDVDASGDASGAGIVGSAFAGVCAAFCAIAGIAPGNDIQLPFKECIEVSISGGDQRGAAVALGGGDGRPVFSGRVLVIVIGVKEQIAGGGPEHLDFRDEAVIDPEPGAKCVG